MHCKHSPALTTRTAGREIVVATQSYKERMRAARAAASAQRRAEKAEYRRRLELYCEVRRLALNAVKAGIRARGDKLSLYSHAQLVAQANAMIGPWLVAQAKRQIAERTGHSPYPICDHSSTKRRGFAMTTAPAGTAKGSVMRPVRRPNAEYRVREHLTETEIEKLLAVLKRNRHGQRDWLIGLMIYRHGLRVSEACDLRWDDIDLASRTIVIRRLKGSRDSTHYLERDELAGLRRLPRQSAYVFVNERGDPFKRMGIARLIERAGEAAGLAFPVHVHMLRHSCGYALANKGWIREGFSTTWAMPVSRTR
jgi:integrase